MALTGLREYRDFPDDGGHAAVGINEKYAVFMSHANDLHESIL